MKKQLPEPEEKVENAEKNKQRVNNNNLEIDSLEEEKEIEEEYQMLQVCHNKDSFRV